MDRVGMLVLAVLLVSASSCSSVQARIVRYYAQFYETIPMADTEIFQPLKPDPIENKGHGYAKHNNVIHSVGGFEVGSLAGMYFYHDVDAVEAVTTITFSKNLAQPYTGSSLNLRARWMMNSDGSQDLDQQELSIVGGQGGFRGASGSVFYQRVQKTPANIFLVTCDIFVDDRRYTIPKTHVDLDAQFINLADAVKVPDEFRPTGKTSLDVPMAATEFSRVARKLL